MPPNTRYVVCFGRKITMEIDTSAAVSVINQAKYDSLRTRALHGKWFSLPFTSRMQIFSPLHPGYRTLRKTIYRPLPSSQTFLPSPPHSPPNCYIVHAAIF